MINEWLSMWDEIGKLEAIKEICATRGPPPVDLTRGPREHRERVRRMVLTELALVTSGNSTQPQQSAP